MLIVIKKSSNTKERLEADLTLLIPNTLQTFLKSSDTDFVEKVSKAFFSANIPLNKLNNKHIKNRFCDIGHSLPSETTCRRTVLQLREDELQRIRNAINYKQIFLVVAENTLSGTPYLNILVRRLEIPDVSYLCDCQPLACAPNSNSITRAVVPPSIVTVKNKTRSARFATIGYQPQPVLTRWGSWLNAALYYAKNLSGVKAIAENFEGFCVLVTQAKDSLQTPGLADQLLKDHKA